LKNDNQFKDEATDSDVSDNIKITQVGIVKEIEWLVHNDDLNYIEAMQEVMEKYELDEEDMKGIVEGPLKHKLEVMAAKRNLIKSDMSKATLFD
jgi:hypothetical protein